MSVASFVGVAALLVGACASAAVGIVVMESLPWRGTAIAYVVVYAPVVLFLGLVLVAVQVLT